MKSLNLKGKSTAIVLILLMAVSSIAIFLPTIDAQSATALNTKDGYVIFAPTASQIPAGVPTIATSPGLIVSPTTVGLGQKVSMIYWINFLPPSVGVESTTVVSGGWSPYTITITKPDGTTDTQGPYESDPSGMWETYFTPTQVGQYMVKFDFGGELAFNLTWGGHNSHNYYYNAYYAPSSRTQNITVGETLATGYVPAPIPSENQYWSRTVEAENREWYTLTGPWLQSGYNATGNFNPYTTSPGSAHILWTENFAANGLIGGDFGSLEYQRYTGFANPVIMGGRLYYTQTDPATGTTLINCANLETGQVEWQAPGSYSFAQILNWRSLQSKIEIPYLWSTGSTYTMYNARTGQVAHTFTGASTGTVVMSAIDPQAIGATIGGSEGGGALLVYMVGYNAITWKDGPGAKIYPKVSNTTKYPQEPTYNGIWVAKWNSTKAITELTRTSITGIPLATVYTLPSGSSAWSLGIEWNKTFTDLPSGGAGFSGYYGERIVTEAGVQQPYPGGGIQDVEPDDILLLSNGGNYTTPVNTATWMALSAETGERLWTRNYQMVAGSYYNNPGSLAHGQFLMNFRENFTTTAFDATTGNAKWSYKFDGNDFIQMGGASGTPAYGNIYFATYDGYITSVNASTGAENWKTLVHASGLEMPEIGYPLGSCAVADGKVFTSSSKSYETEPLYRGHKLTCLDATTGAQLWNISGQMTSQTIAMGYLLTTNNYDGGVYCFGKGQTATTVTAPMNQIAVGSKVVIQGTVMDLSPAQPDTPAISDIDQTAWMEYLHMDKALPSSATGVAVSIDAVDPNGNFVHLGDAHSDSTGTYGYVWTPPAIPGQYNIIASFFGSESYYSSLGETTAIVVDAPASTPAATPLPQSVSDMYFVPAVAAIIVVIVLVGVVLLLVLRKRP